MPATLRDLGPKHVVNVVGGSESREKYGGQPGPRFTPVTASRQREAVRFLNENAFRIPRYLIDAEIARRIEPEGELRRIGSAQSRVLYALLDGDRLARIAEYEALAPGSRSIYTLGEMLTDVRRSVWSELGANSVVIDPFRRRLQRTWLAQADGKINPSPAIIISSSGRAPRSRDAAGPNNDVRALMRGELIALDASIRSALSRASDRTTRLHLLDAREEIRRILDPES